MNTANMTATVDQLTYECPHCEIVMQIDEDIVGKTTDCPTCDKPFKVTVPQASLASEAQVDESTPEVVSAERDEKTLMTAHPVMFRSHPLRFLGECLLMIAGLALIGQTAFSQSYLPTVAQISLGSLMLLAGAGLMTYWWLTVYYTTLSITNNRSSLRQGIFARNTTEVRHDDVRNIQVNQNIYQRAVGTGDIAISSAGQDNLEIDVDSIPQPEELATTVRDLQ